MKIARFNPFRLLNSVPFGILLMALTAIYIAMGSARPWLRDMGIDEWPLFRNWFDKTDLQFFNSWPLKTLMLLLVMNLIVVTWRKIPLTPPRYGVWCIHSGIITLICGSAMYYYLKVEGRVRIYTDASIGPATVDHFYDKDERSLYVRIGQEEPVEIPLPTLPRFKEYDENFGNTGALASRGLTGIAPALEVTDGTSGEKRQENLAELIGCKGQQIKFDIVGFYPYATTSTDFTSNPTSQMSGVDVTMQTIADQQAVNEWWLVGSDPRFRTNVDQGLMDMQHVDADANMVSVLTEAVGKLFHLDVILPDQPAVPLDVQIGKTYSVAGYTLQIESYQPSWSMFGTGEQAQMLQMLVTSPTQKFRRMVLQDKSVQTDFKLGDTSAGPMGKRQKAPLDTVLKMDFHVHDPYQLLPVQNSVKHTLLTPPNSTELIDITAGFGTVASDVKRSPSGTEDLQVTPDQGMDAPFAGGAATPSTDAPDPAAANHPAVKIHVERKDHLRPVDSIIVVPPARRDKNAEDEGDYQVAKIKVTMGNWSGIVFAPFAEDAGDRLRQDHWRGGYVAPPGSIAPLQVQLGNTRRPLPVRLTLDNFKLIPYPGASVDTPNAMMLDFISTVTMTDLESGDSYTDKAQMNHPIYFNNGSWLFFQAAYDSSGGHEWTRLGVGNRPAVRIMIAGCLMIFFGLAYAFYAKPLIIRRMKEKAIAKAMAEGKMARPAERKELVSS